MRNETEKEREIKEGTEEGNRDWEWYEKEKREKRGREKERGGCRKKRKSEMKNERKKRRRIAKSGMNYFLTSPIMKSAFFLFKSVASSTLLSWVNCKKK